MTTPFAARRPAPPTGAAPPRPLEVARAGLQRELDPRYVQFPSLASSAGSEPLVVPLGAADTLGDAVFDPYAGVRPRATVHLTARAVLVGPWADQYGSREAGGEKDVAGRRSPCGTCLGLHWQLLHGRSPRADPEPPVLTPLAVDVVRDVWSAVFDPPGRRGRPAAGGVPAGAARLTCVDLRTPVPRTFRLHPEPRCESHTGCGG